MKKLLTLFGVICFSQIGALNVVACTDPVENPNNEEKPVLTQEIFDEFFDNDPTVNYTGAYVFNDGNKFDDWTSVTSIFLRKIAIETLYKELSNNYTNNDFAFLTGSFDDNSIIFKTNEMITIRISMPFRTTSQKDEKKNDTLNFTLNFKQTNKMTGTELLEEIFNAYFTRYFFRNNPTEINTSRTEDEERYTAWGAPNFALFSQSELEELQDNPTSKVEYLTNAYYGRMEADSEIDSLLNNINVKILDCQDYKEIGGVKYYKIKAKLFLESSPEIFIEKEFIDWGY
ncbi:hypothetical protein SCLARK_00743 [Spiroplasma clarkii]|uniref:Lipoprotein n=1 Tax=Spiroplasma clarkii TaxID=2139 RepID=A0A1Y0L0U3_9MOLU|nr:hypothetical protein [Spiroplasma clarkii]ARU91390.1 hypothetical protein SCLARK_00743 [Spiroplasma clarkii]ATX70804.1 hypothetical protein SCLAR_v1c04830 [Spiroplasma clarkii]